MTAAPGATIYIPMDHDVKAHLIINVFGMAITLAVIILRIVARLQVAGLGWDDYLVIAGYTLGIAFMGVTAPWATMGEGHDLLPTSPYYKALLNNVPAIMKLTLVAQTLYIISLTCLKSSILCFYLRVFARDGKMRRATQMMLVLVVCWGLAFTLYMFLVCRPLNTFWDLVAATTHCGNQILMYSILITTNIATDLLIMAMPLYTIWHLQMKTPEKIALTGCFALGLGVVALGAARLKFVLDVSMQANFTGSVDMTVFLVQMEIYFSCLSPSIPVLRPFYRRWRANHSSSRINGSGYNDQYYADNSRSAASMAKRSRNRNPLGSTSFATTTFRDGDEDVELNAYNEMQAHKVYDGKNIGHRPEVNDQGSEVFLTDAHAGHKIGVKTQWVVTHE